MTARRRILVVEDDPAIRTGLVDALSFGGYDVDAAGLAAEGQRQALALELDLVILDVVLPDGSGLDVLDEIRRCRPRLPVILVTALSRREDRERGIDVGANAYITKGGFDQRDLLEAIRRLVKLKGFVSASADQVATLGAHTARITGFIGTIREIADLTNLIALNAAIRGMKKLSVNHDAITADLNATWEVLGEAVQTVMRKHGHANPYEQLKERTRGTGIDAESLRAFIADLNLPADEKSRLLALTPDTYIGLAPLLAHQGTD